MIHAEETTRGEGHKWYEIGEWKEEYSRDDSMLGFGFGFRVA